ncbi:MAG: hypothetical protein M3158_02005, partial [Pseudomonadota bacterium]|nr:hypothetical protein [Pseudomonadota bacterium]
RGHGQRRAGTGPTEVGGFETSQGAGELVSRVQLFRSGSFALLDVCKKPTEDGLYTVYIGNMVVECCLRSQEADALMEELRRRLTAD